jgi:hypothetical protein
MRTRRSLPRLPEAAAGAVADRGRRATDRPPRGDHDVVNDVITVMSHQRQHTQAKHARPLHAFRRRAVSQQCREPKVSRMTR